MRDAVKRLMSRLRDAPKQRIEPAPPQTRRARRDAEQRERAEAAEWDAEARGRERARRSAEQIAEACARVGYWFPPGHGWD